MTNICLKMLKITATVLLLTIFIKTEVKAQMPPHIVPDNNVSVNELLNKINENMVETQNGLKDEQKSLKKMLKATGEGPVSEQCESDEEDDEETEESTEKEEEKK